MYMCVMAAISVSSTYAIHNVLSVLWAVLYILVKLMIIIIIMYCICAYVYMYVGRIRVSNVPTVHACSLYRSIILNSDISK